MFASTARRSAGIQLTFLAAAVALLAACSGSAALPPAEGGGTPAAATAAPANPAAGLPDGERTGAGSDSNGSAPRPTAGPATLNEITPGGPLIIRTGTLTLQVADLNAALAAAEKLVVDAGGYVSAGQRSGDGERATASVTYRIPAARFETTLDALRGVGQKLLGEQLSSDEVTAQVVDLGARITNLRATEAALQKIMEQATKIPDILQVQDQLSTTRDEIERLTAQQQTLQQQAALATLTVQFGLPPAVAVEQVQQGWNPAAVADRASAALVGFAQSVAEAGIWLGILVLPIALLLGVPLLAFVLIARRRRRNRPGPPAAQASSAIWPAG